MAKPTWTEDLLIEAVKVSLTRADVLRKLGLQVKPGNYETLRNYIRKLGLDTSHMTGKAHGTSIPGNKKSASEVFVKNSNYARHNLKHRILKENLIPNQCAICGMLPVWEGEPLVLVLDHINGVPDDHRLKNLRLLCPNCNSQTDTFCSNKTKKPPIPCIHCGEPTHKTGSGVCMKCAGVSRRLPRPKPDKLQQLVKENGYRGTGKILGVSDKTVKNWYVEMFQDSSVGSSV